MDITCNQAFLNIALPGHLTASNVYSGVDRFLDTLEKTPSIETVVVDARGLTRVDGTTLRFLSCLKRHCDSSKLHFQLVNPSPDTQLLLKLFRLTSEAKH